MKGILAAVLILSILSLYACGRQAHGPSTGGTVPAAPADPNKMTPDQESKLLLQYERGFCSWNSYAYQYNANYDNIKTFFQQQVNSGFLTAGETGSDFGSQAQNFPYTDDGGFPSMAQFWWSPGWEVRVKDCMYVASSVSILDTTYDASEKTARVIFRNTGSVPTAFGRAFTSWRGPPEPRQMWLGNSKVTGILEVDNVELIASFQRLDATGWRVTGVMRSQ